jgi:hypothetical protein
MSPEESSMSHPTEQIHIKQDVPSSIDPSSSLSKPSHAEKKIRSIVGGMAAILDKEGRGYWPLLM